MERLNYGYKKNKLIKRVIITATSNGIINGVIQYFLLKDKGSIAISVNSISNTEETVLGTAVVLAITFSMILTVIAYFGIKEKKVKFFPNAFWLTIKHGFSLLVFLRPLLCYSNAIWEL
ncbi:hypothetical protein [Maribacter sp. ACAM166]|uniref:hypothetical protein n=1 Tax=Maribacter sp. ACAM166 TaxID=2508996 RepID=UPI0010FDC294|nr:hypothetical protein [Maribacter sp. ACAM166]TLP71787.1 hypothetical protein ES765_19460 [Maribacter sp. ACAM166]